MQRYRRINALNYVSAEAVNNAATTEDATEMIASAKLIGKYEFVEMPKLTEAIGKIESAEILSEILPNGASVNRVLVNGSIRCRAFGNERKAIPAQDLKKTDFSKLKFGKCVSDGETITETKVCNGGEVKEIAVIYCNISALL